MDNRLNPQKNAEIKPSNLELPKSITDAAITAIKLKKTDDLTALICQYPDLLNYPLNAFGHTPLIMAVTMQNKEIMTTLVTMGADLLTQDHTGKIALEYCLDNEALATFLKSPIPTIEQLATKIQTQIDALTQFVLEQINQETPLSKTYANILQCIHTEMRRLLIEKKNKARIIDLYLLVSTLCPIIKSAKTLQSLQETLATFFAEREKILENDAQQYSLSNSIANGICREIAKIIFFDEAGNILYQQALKTRTTPWYDAYNNSQQLPAESREFFQDSQKKIHLYEGILQQAITNLIKGATAQEHIWIGTDASAKNMPLTKEDIEQLKGRTPTFRTLIEYTEKITFFAKENSRSLLERLNILRHGLLMGDKQHGMPDEKKYQQEDRRQGKPERFGEYQAGRTAYIAIAEFADWWNTLDQTPYGKNLKTKLYAIKTNAARAEDVIYLKDVIGVLLDMSHLTKNGDNKRDSSIYCVHTKGQMLDAIFADPYAQKQIAEIEEVSAAHAKQCQMDPDSKKARLEKFQSGILAELKFPHFHTTKQNQFEQIESSLPLLQTLINQDCFSYEMLNIFSAALFYLDNLKRRPIAICKLSPEGNTSPLQTCLIALVMGMINYQEMKNKHAVAIALTVEISIHLLVHDQQVSLGKYLALHTSLKKKNQTLFRIHGAKKDTLIADYIQKQDSVPMKELQWFLDNGFEPAAATPTISNPSLFSVMLRKRKINALMLLIKHGLKIDLQVLKSLSIEQDWKVIVRFLKKVEKSDLTDDFISHLLEQIIRKDDVEKMPFLLQKHELTELSLCLMLEVGAIQSLKHTLQTYPNLTSAAGVVEAAKNKHWQCVNLYLDNRPVYEKSRRLISFHAISQNNVAEVKNLIAKQLFLMPEYRNLFDIAFEHRNAELLAMLVNMGLRVENQMLGYFFILFQWNFLQKFIGLLQKEKPWIAEFMDDLHTCIVRMDDVDKFLSFPEFANKRYQSFDLFLKFNAIKLLRNRLAIQPDLVNDNGLIDAAVNKHWDCVTTFLDARPTTEATRKAISLQAIKQNNLVQVKLLMEKKFFVLPDEPTLFDQVLAFKNPELLATLVNAGLAEKQELFSRPWDENEMLFLQTYFTLTQTIISPRLYFDAMSSGESHENNQFIQFLYTHKKVHSSEDLLLAVKHHLPRYFQYLITNHAFDNEEAVTQAARAGRWEFVAPYAMQRTISFVTLLILFTEASKSKKVDVLNLLAKQRSHLTPDQLNTLKSQDSYKTALTMAFKQQHPGLMMFFNQDAQLNSVRLIEAKQENEPNVLFYEAKLNLLIAALKAELRTYEATVRSRFFKRQSRQRVTSIQQVRETIEACEKSPESVKPLIELTLTVKSQKVNTLNHHNQGWFSRLTTSHLARAYSTALLQTIPIETPEKNSSQRYRPVKK